MTRQIIFSPLVDEWLLVSLAVLLAVLILYGLWRGLAGWWLRLFASAALLAALANPSVQTEERTPLSDIVILVVDDSASQRISDRPQQTEEALARLTDEIARLPNTELRVVHLGDAPDGEGTLLMTALAQALADEPRGRVAGMILLTDGQFHDLPLTPDLPAPLHALLTGHDTDWDRRLLVTNAPAFAILGEPVTLTLRVEDQGAVPETGGMVTLDLSVDGGDVQQARVPVGRDIELPVTLPHGGMNVIQFSLAAAPGELTDRNNTAVVRINGVRDRLRVLLVSGEPHPGERTWRNLLKSDGSVDLVHFTILRPPEKQDGVPVNELSLIAFPTRELFLEKIDQFDLIIFDRYKRRGILPMIYLDNVREYTENGGALLIAAGPEFASAASLYRTPLGDIIPGEPTARVIEKGFRPVVTDLGRRHPVTEALESASPDAGAEPSTGGWGRWFRQIDVTAKTGEVVMSGPEDRPLLLLDRVGEGRVALLASDHAWLWNRGFEGGGPQLELLRRLAHWLMKEPELEEEALWVTNDGQSMTIVRRTLGESVNDFSITAPDGTVMTVIPEQTSPGRFEARVDGADIGIYRITDGELKTVAALGPTAPREFEQTIASGDLIEPVVDPTRGGVMAIEDDVPDVRKIGPGRPAAGRGWIGIASRDAYQTLDVRVSPLLPSWLFLLMAAALCVAAWLWEGRRSRSRKAP